ncbi:S8 family serine peptidase, partial [Klugiella xanthotipulae]
MTRPWRVGVRVFGAGVVVAVLGGVGLVPAAAEGTPGLWYYDNYGVQEAHDSGFTGQGVTIAIIDSPLYREMPALADANITVREPSYCDLSDTPGTRAPATSSNPEEASHGTEMTMFIAGNGDGGAPGVQAPLGVAPDAQINYYAALFRNLDFGPDFSSVADCYRDKKGAFQEALAEAITQAVDDGADIISMSLGAG